jgi:ADP-ribose pyrophosphatase
MTWTGAEWLCRPETPVPRDGTNMPTMETLLASKRIYQGRVVSLKVDTVSLPSGRITTREVVERPDTVGILALDERNNMLVVRQPRYVLARETLEIPAGTINPDESPRDAALRELREETGYAAGEMTQLLEYGPAIGYCTERMTLFLAKDLVAAPLRGDEEKIGLERLPFDLVYRDLVRGQPVFEDAKSTLAVLLARARGLA